MRWPCAWPCLSVVSGQVHILQFSRAVPHPSTNRALRRLTSEAGRDPVHSTRYGRQQRELFQTQTQATLRNTRESKAGSTLRFSRAVPHPSTNRALRRLTSEVGRDPVHSTRYGRQQRELFLSPMPMFMMNNRGATFGLSTRKNYAPLVYHGVSF